MTAAMQQQDADVFSVFCRQIVGSWAERLLLPLICDVVLCFLPFPLLRLPVPAAATAFGGLLAFRRPAYDRLGGFAAVRGRGGRGRRDRPPNPAGRSDAGSGPWW